MWNYHLYFFLLNYLQLKEYIKKKYDVFYSIVEQEYCCQSFLEEELYHIKYYPFSVKLISRKFFTEDELAIVHQ